MDLRNSPRRWRRVKTPLREWLERTGYSQRELIALVREASHGRVQITDSAMSHWVNGRFGPSLNKAIVLARVTGLPVEKLAKPQANDEAA